MEENIDVTKELQIKNKEILLNKKKIDLDTSIESLLVFYNNYTGNIANDINNRICLMKNVDINSEQAKIYYNTITSFFVLTGTKLKEIINSNVEPLKERLDTISDEEYNIALNQLSIVVINKILDYYVENASMLSNELNQDVDEDTKNRINKYISDILTIKMINMLRDKFLFSIKVIGNNYEENKEIIENINEKTLK